MTNRKAYSKSLIFRVRGFIITSVVIYIWQQKLELCHTPPKSGNKSVSNLDDPLTGCAGKIDSKHSKPYAVKGAKLLISRLSEQVLCFSLSGMCACHKRR